MYAYPLKGLWEALKNAARNAAPHGEASVVIKWLSESEAQKTMIKGMYGNNPECIPQVRFSNEGFLAERLDGL